MAEIKSEWVAAFVPADLLRNQRRWTAPCLEALISSEPTCKSANLRNFV